MNYIFWVQYPTKAEQEEFQHDTRTLTRLRHPNIVLLIAVTPPGYTPMAVMTELMRFVFLLASFPFFLPLFLLPASSASSACCSLILI